MSAFRLAPHQLAVFSDITCGEACWHAREDVCRCECGGKNHGCLRTADGVQPVRTCRIAGERYELAAVGWHGELFATAKRTNEAGWKYIDRGMPDHPYHYSWRETDDGAPMRLKTAPMPAVASWPELLAYREHPDYLNRVRTIYCLWRKIEPPPLHWCAVQCDRCDTLCTTIKAGGAL